ncbi:hypothetical protein BDY21DRAFT_352186 [Lineolata rhizophorae]|uniref:Uncharacterized protein n=1 Tax=Lineolata rhizophorae TaxID=578093 RepID=A0A6A6NS86_9PEZI|nr:hypothetical protein BDY21DRAFT_352186 [Lineolata rhizophorae]
MRAPQAPRFGQPPPPANVGNDGRLKQACSSQGPPARSFLNRVCSLPSPTHFLPLLAVASRVPSPPSQLHRRSAPQVRGAHAPHPEQLQPECRRRLAATSAGPRRGLSASGAPHAALLGLPVPS